MHFDLNALSSFHLPPFQQTSQSGGTAYNSFHEHLFLKYVQYFVICKLHKYLIRHSFWIKNISKLVFKEIIYSSYSFQESAKLNLSRVNDEPSTRGNGSVSLALVPICISINYYVCPGVGHLLLYACIFQDRHKQIIPKYAFHNKPTYHHSLRSSITVCHT